MLSGHLALALVPSVDHINKTNTNAMSAKFQISPTRKYKMVLKKYI